MRRAAQPHCESADGLMADDFKLPIGVGLHSAQNARLQIDAHREGLFSRSELVRQIDGQIRIGIFAFADAELAGKRLARKRAHAALAAFVIVGVGLPAHFRIQLSPCWKF